jgi:hypothetical protein
MNPEQVLAGLRGVADFLAWLMTAGERDERARSDAISAVSEAARKTKRYLDDLASGQPEDFSRADEISALWSNASSKIAYLNPNLANECEIKAYGWGSRSWNDDAFTIVPRKVEEVLADALKLRDAK